MEGVTALVAALDRIRGRFSRDAVEAVVVEACKPTAEAMRAGAPRLTGEMAESIDARPVQPERPELVTVAIGPDRDHFYARFAEFGTASQPAHPFMRPAWDSDVGALRGRLADGFGELLTGGVA
ncbi:MAG TPA: HK97-gp10 family putative phage morphogenesis protein [Actinomycetes bacterium]|nr:HK97-gp10 family putative phage morphogenesis protein [Actinomycetes bacterium]